MRRLKTNESEYNPTELLICIAARQMPDSVTAFIGTGIPMLAASLAQKTHAPNLVTIFEFGGTGAQLVKLPRAVGESRTFYRGVAASGICDIMETATRGFGITRPKCACPAPAEATTWDPSAGVTSSSCDMTNAALCRRWTFSPLQAI